MQKLTDTYIKDIGSILELKENEIMEI
ncbi:MAG: hypothetical protein L3J12_03980 [Spirochaetales bacterium]|nr:hypothetical protein [Spirochaetales bacterium]